MAVASATPPTAPAPVSPAPVAAEPPAQPAPPAAQSAEPAKPEAAAEPAPSPATTAAVAPPAPEPTATARLMIKATDDCWIELRDGTGAVIVARLLHKGDAFPVPPQKGETLTVGNAGAVTLVLDGNALPPLGKAGMVRHDVPIDPEHLTGQPTAG